MRCIFIVVMAFGISESVRGQVSTSVMNATSYREMSSNKLIQEYVTFGLMVKKPVGLSWTLGTGFGYKSVETRLVDYINDSDFASFFREKYPSKSLPLNAYFSESNLYRFNFVYFPFGAEFALVPGMRIRYMYNVNWLFKSNINVKDYLEYGRESASRFSGNHDFALLLLNPVTQGHLIIGVVTQPQLLNSSLSYEYQFTQDFYKKFSRALSFYLGINYEFNAKPRKRSIL